MNGTSVLFSRICVSLSRCPILVNVFFNMDPANKTSFFLLVNVLICTYCCLVYRRKPQHHDRNTKYGRSGRAPARDGKRAYDRHSGTGRGKEMKKGGGGAHNWGSDKDEARLAEGLVLEEDREDDEVDDNKQDEEADSKKEPEQPPEKPTMSYEEYMASKQSLSSVNSAFAPVEERRVENEFSKVKATVAVEEDFLVMGDDKQKRTRTKKEQKQTVRTGFRVAANAENKDRDARGGGRGRGRGGRAREGGRGGSDGRGRDGRGRDGRGRDGRGRDGRGRGGGRGPRGSGRGGGRRAGSGRDGGGRGGRGRGSTGGLNVTSEEAFPSL